METSIWLLWLPVVVSGVVLFFASWAAWMALPHHKSTCQALPDEAAVKQVIKDTAISPGQYVFPHCHGASDMKSEAFRAGPHGVLCVVSGPPSMAANMVGTLLFFVAVSFVIAYLAAMVMAPGTDAMRVFRFVTTVGVLTYGTANILNGIWFRKKMVADVVDGVVYGLLTGAIFAWLWPAAAAVVAS